MEMLENMGEPFRFLHAGLTGLLTGTNEKSPFGDFSFVPAAGIEPTFTR
jgi:hypothetical protein